MNCASASLVPLVAGVADASTDRNGSRRRAGTPRILIAWSWLAVEGLRRVADQLLIRAEVLAQHGRVVGAQLAKFEDRTLHVEASRAAASMEASCDDALAKKSAARSDLYFSLSAMLAFDDFVLLNCLLSPSTTTFFARSSAGKA